MRSLISIILSGFVCLALAACMGSGGGDGGGDDSGGVARIDLSIDNAIVYADGVSTRTIQADVSASGNSTISGLRIEFSTSLGSLSSSFGYTDTSGVAAVTLIAPTESGTASVTASYEDVNQVMFVEFLPAQGNPAQVSGLSASPSPAQAGGDIIISARILNEQGGPVSGESVTLNLASNGSGAAFSSQMQVSDASGWVYFTYTAGSRAGVDVFRLVTDSGLEAGPLSVPVEAAGNLVGSVLLTAAGASIVADGFSSLALSVQVNDPSGTPIAGTPVTLTATDGTLTSEIVQTDVAGSAGFSLISSTTAGAVRVTASAGGVTNSVTVDFTAGVPAAFDSFNLSPNTVSVLGSSLLQAKVVDANGNPVPGEAVTFVVTQNGSGASTTSVAAATDASGQAQATYVAGASVGTDRIEARTSNGVTTTDRVLIVSQTASEPSSISLALGAGAPVSITADGASSTALQATVLDNSGAAMQGVSVAFSSSLGSLSSAAVDTDATGVARTSLIAGTTAGQAQVTAAAGTVTDSLVVPITPGDAQSLDLSFQDSEVDSLPADGTSSLVVIATVYDGQANGVQGETITFSSEDGNLATVAPVTGTTNDLGQVQISVIAGNQTGTVKITATLTTGLGVTLTDSVYVDIL